MTRGELEQMLPRLGFRRSAYDCRMYQEMSYCIVESEGVFSVFYAEKGGRNDEAKYADEDAACADLLRRLQESPGSRS